MSQKYSGGFITKSPVAPTSSAASGIWTLDQQQQAQKAGTWPSPPIFIEDLFSTYLYTGNGTSQTITNGIDLSGQGGLTWIKKRNAAEDHVLTDTVRGAGNTLFSNLTDANEYDITRLSAFTSSGFSVGGSSRVNQNANTFVSWTFREQPKFFDIVTYSGSNSTQTISHNLGSAPGCIMIKKLDSNTFNAGWAVYHRSLTNPNNYYLVLNSTAAETNYGGAFISSVSSTTFTVAGNAGSISLAGSTYVAYLFAHDAGGFPVSGGGSTNGISCGSFTTDASSVATVNLGYEPQWVMFKCTSTTDNWRIVDNMRGFANAGSSSDARLFPNSSSQEFFSDTANPTATGFVTQGDLQASQTYIYIAIRRGPMKVPTSGTSVFAPLIYTGDGTSGRLISGAGFPPDLLIQTARSTSENREFDDRLRGGGSTAMNALFSNLTNAEAADSGSVQLLNQDGFTVRSFGNGSSVTYIGECFRRAPSFFDVVCYTGTGANASFTHNLGVVPEMMIVKGRSVNANWAIYTATTGATQSLFFTDVAAGTYSVVWNDTAPTASVFTVGTAGTTNSSGGTYVAYLFATVAGVSKVGTYTGTGALQTVNCGFTSGARFVLIKRTDSTGDWFTYDSARGITSGNDPYLLLNSTAAEVTGTNYVDTISSGFQVTAAAPAGLNANGGTYIFLAIA